MRKFYKETRLIISVLVLIVILGIGYAFLGANLKINGVANIPSSSWNVRFKANSISVTTGSVAVDTSNNEQAATIDNDITVSYRVRLALPGDFYEFKVKVENTGSIDAMIDSISSKLGNTEITTGTLPSYLNYTVTYSDGVPIASHHLLASNSEEEIKVRIEFKKDIEANQLPGTDATLNLNFQIDYVQADSSAITPPHPVSFSTDDWSTIITVAQNGNTSVYTVGSTKSVTLNIDLDEDGTPEDHTYTLRIANNSTPAECSSEGFSQTACGFVLEFADIITIHQMNPFYDNGTIGTGNVGGWASSEMRTYINSDIYNALPAVLKNAIIDTTVVSGHGPKDTTNFTSTDKLYLLSTHEVWEDVDGNTSSGIDYMDTAYNNTRQLDYYRDLNITTSSYAGAKKQNNGSDDFWWLRSALSYDQYAFLFIYNHGNWDRTNSNGTNGVAPAFRIA